jgi:hypothetical protein
VNLDDLELQLRKLPGVQSAGFSETDDAVFVHIHADDGPAHGLATAAAHLAIRYFERPVTVELVRWRTVPAPTSEAATDHGSGAAPAPERVELADDKESIQHPRPPAIESAAVVARDAPSARERRAKRVQLVAILASPDTDELEVRVSWNGQQSVGRAPASRGLMGSVEATFEAVRTFADSLPFQPGWARTIETIWQTQFLVATAVIGPEHTAARYGLAAGDSPVEAAARATLHALNRTLTGELHTNGQ